MTWDWLQECDLVTLPAVKRRVQPGRAMPEAQALRDLLMEAAQQVAQSLENIPDKTNVRLFIEKYLEGKRMGDIARELEVSRVWVSQSYRKEALRLASDQFARLVSTKG